MQSPRKSLWLQILFARPRPELRKLLAQMANLQWQALPPGGSACPTKTQTLPHQCGTDASVCQPGDSGEFFTASEGAGSSRCTRLPTDSFPASYAPSDTPMPFPLTPGAKIDACRPPPRCDPTSHGLSP